MVSAAPQKAPPRQGTTDPRDPQGLTRGEHVTEAQQQLCKMIRDLITEGATTGTLRDDVAPDELATYCLHAVTAARNLLSKAAVQRLVGVTFAGLQPVNSADSSSCRHHTLSHRGTP